VSQVNPGQPQAVPGYPRLTQVSLRLSQVVPGFPLGLLGLFYYRLGQLKVDFGTTYEDLRILFATV